MLTISEAVLPIDESGPLPAPLASWDSFGPSDLLLCVKGAPDVLLSRCTHVLALGGDGPLNLTYGARQRIIAVQEQWAAQGRRVLVLARRVIERDLLPKHMDPNVVMRKTLTNLSTDSTRNSSLPVSSA
jgi:sodium/potassium-transporting ATPase subunit alpha